jgi:hypothetical protein
MPDKSNNSFRRLRKRVERALAGGERGVDVMRDLETIVRQAADGDRDALFAHRQLAELRLEESPWCAALHLRKLILADAADDGVFALMGLCQAMLGNFRAAISTYQRAIELAPRNPWYHHNLGHLLDVGLGNARSAQKHLRLAHDLEPREDEITASLAHCLARVGQLAEARTLAAEALRGAPGNRDHRALLDWVERGAPGARLAQRTGKHNNGRVQVQPRTAQDSSGTTEPRGAQEPRGAREPHGASESRGAQSRGAQSPGVHEARNAQAPRERGLTSTAPALRGGASVRSAPDARGEQQGRDERSHAGTRGTSADQRARSARVEPRDPVAHMLASNMPDAGFSPEHVRRAQALWVDYGGRVGRPPSRAARPAVYAAAIEYAIAMVHGVRGVTQAALAHRYGVAPATISSRYAEIRSALALVPGDPRYCLAGR